MPNLIKKHGNLPRRKEDDPFFAIWRHYHDVDTDIILTPGQIQRLSIYERAKDIYDEGFSRGETVKNLQVEFEKKGIEFSIRTAYDYLRDALDLFGEGEKINLSREKHSMIETAKRLMKKAEAAEAWGPAVTALKAVIELYGFDKETDDITEMIKKLGATKIVITSDAEALKKEADELIEDILHEDVG